MSVKQDRQGVRTPTDIERRYNLGRIDDTERKSTDNASQISRLNQAMAQNMANMNAEIAAMQQSLAEFANLIYPVGSIYISTKSTSPATLFGGTWERIQDTFLLAAGESYAAGATGGSATTTIEMKNLPHKTIVLATATADGATSAGKWSGVIHDISAGNNHATTAQLSSYGYAADNPLDNMPPYLTVYVWKRTA